MRIRVPTRAVICAALVVMVGCRAADYVTDATERVGAADWSKMKIVKVVLDEYAFSPSELVFHQGVPYKLQIANEGSSKHYFTAGKFFRAIATRKVQSNADGEIKAPYFLALEVFPDRSLDLYFIPVRQGTYRLRCTIHGHAERGMTGRIVIK